MRFRPIILTIYITIIGSFLPLHAGASDYIVYKRDSKTTSIQMPNEAAEYSVYINTTGGVFATGQAAKNLTQKPDATINKNLPPRPNQIELLDQSGKLFAGLTAIGDSNQIFSTARHVLTDGTLQQLEKAFQQYRLNLHDFDFYEFTQSNQIADFIIIVSRNNESLIFDKIADNQYKLKKLFPVIQPGDNYVTYQYGVTGQDITKQFSEGRIHRISDKDIYLDLSDYNFTSPRSSGAIVYFNVNSNWMIGGSISCVVPPRTTQSGYPIPGGVRVISLQKLQSAIAQKIPIEKLLSEPRKFDPDCLPVDPRDGG